MGGEQNVSRVSDEVRAAWEVGAVEGLAAVEGILERVERQRDEAQRERDALRAERIEPTAPVARYWHTRYQKLEGRVRVLEEAEKLVRRLAQWDSLNPPLPGDRYGDAPYWKRELDRVVELLDAGVPVSVETAEERNV